jgi:hypothetical protein
MAQLDEEIAIQDAKMKVGYDLLDAGRDFWYQKDEVEAAEATIAEADKEIMVYDVLAEALAPDGILCLTMTAGLDIELSGSPMPP